ncbi:MAG: YncE family protein, partial [candidate division WOR-3 bacterium]
MRPDTPGLAVIDITTDTITKMLPAGAINPFNAEFSIPSWGFGYSSTSDRLFSSAPKDWRSGEIFIIDCTGDSVVMRIPGYPPSGRMWWDSAGNKMYFASVAWFVGVDWITVVDCASGQVLGVIPTGQTNPTSGIYFPQYRKIYAAGDYGEQAVVIDCVTDRIIKRFEQIISLGSKSALFGPCYASSVNKVYFPSGVRRPRGIYGDTILIIDPELDSIIGGIHVEPRVPRARDYRAGIFWGMDYAPWSNRLYVYSCEPGRQFISVYDCATDSLVGQITCSFSAEITQIFCNPVDHKIYILSQEDSAIFVFRDSLVGIAEPEENRPVAVAGVPTVVRNILYLPDTGDPGYVLLDITGSRV